jgi:hypothetical protein
MHKSVTKCNETIGKWCKNKHGASKIIDTLETYHRLKAKSWWATNVDERKLVSLLSPSSNRVPAISPAILPDLAARHIVAAARP